MHLFCISIWFLVCLIICVYACIFIDMCACVGWSKLLFKNHRAIPVMCNQPWYKGARHNKKSPCGPGMLQGIDCTMCGRVVDGSAVTIRVGRMCFWYFVIHWHTNRCEKGPRLPSTAMDCRNVGPHWASLVARMQTFKLNAKEPKACWSMTQANQPLIRGRKLLHLSIHSSSQGQEIGGSKLLKCIVRHFVP